MVQKLFQWIFSAIQKLLLVFVAHYAYVQHILGCVLPNSIATLFGGILTCILLPTIFLPIILIFTTYKYIVYVTLWMRHGKAFRGLITGCSLTLMLKKIRNHRIWINAIMTIRSDKSGEELYEDLKTRLWDKLHEPGANKKWFTIQKYFLGYYYYKEINGVKMNDVINQVKLNSNQINQDELLRILNEETEKSLPFDNKFNWDMSLITTPYVDSAGDKCFVLLFRVHHCLVDGPTLYNFLSQTFAEANDAQTTYAQNLNKNLNKKYGMSSKLRMNLQENAKDILAPHFHSSGDAMAIYLESEENYIKKIKRIRSKFPGTSFLSVVIAAYSATLAEYYKENLPDDVPEFVKTLGPVQINMKRFSDYYTGKYALDLENDFAIIAYDVPIIPKNKSHLPIAEYLFDRLAFMNREFDKVSASADAKVNYVLMKTYFEVLPYEISASLFANINFTLGTSCMPGGPRMKLFNGDDIKSITYSIPPTCFGLGLFIMTYDNRLQFSLRGEKKLFSDGKDLDSILAGILKYIDMMEEQCKKLY